MAQTFDVTDPRNIEKMIFGFLYEGRKKTVIARQMNVTVSFIDTLLKNNPQIASQITAATGAVTNYKYYKAMEMLRKRQSHYKICKYLKIDKKTLRDWINRPPQIVTFFKCDQPGSVYSFLQWVRKNKPEAYAEFNRTFEDYLKYW